MKTIQARDVYAEVHAEMRSYVERLKLDDDDFDMSVLIMRLWSLRASLVRDKELDRLEAAGVPRRRSTG